jgi:hypothetical protein
MFEQAFKNIDDVLRKEAGCTTELDYTEQTSWLLYETKIKNMGNAGRNGGEYYTPRPLIRAIVRVTNPQLGETIYDGAQTIDPETFDLSVKNPSGGEQIAHRSAEEIMDEIAALDSECAVVLSGIRKLL